MIDATAIGPDDPATTRLGHQGPGRRGHGPGSDRYGDAEYERLALIKARYDPDNIFRRNVKPG